MHLVNEDFAKLPEFVREDYALCKQTLWESANCSKSERLAKEMKLIREHQANERGSTPFSTDRSNTAEHAGLEIRLQLFRMQFGCDCTDPLPEFLQR